jgi:hypothetical protein
VLFAMSKAKFLFRSDYEEKWELEAWESSKNLTKQIAQAIENLG